jgi:hypothetical protein
VNGKPGDDAALDILEYGRTVFSPEIDAMVRDLARLMDFRRLQDFLNPLTTLSVDAAGVRIRQRLEKLREEGKERGWEIE